MRIVKLHNRKQQDFDAFLKQRLNQAEVDRSAMEGYMEGMSFPVAQEPVLPRKQNGLLKKGLLLFIFLLSSYMSHYVVTDNKGIGKGEYVNTKPEVANENKTISRVSEADQHSVATASEKFTEKPVTKKDAFNNAKPAGQVNKENNLRNTVVANAPYPSPGKDSANFPASTITTDPLKELPALQTQKPKADSLYIIW